MKFALIGDHPDVNPLLREIRDHQDHQLEYAACLERPVSQLKQFHPDVQVMESWEQLLTLDDIDAFILSGCNKESQTAARTIASETGRPFLIVPLPGPEWTAIYDFTYIQNESTLWILPLLKFRFHPLVSILTELLDQKKIGQINRIEFQQELSQDQYSPSLSQTEWDPILLHTIDFLRLTGGDYHRVTSIPSGTTDQNYSVMNLTLSGDDLPDSQATFRSGSEKNSWQLKILGSEGEILLSGSDENESGNLLVNGEQIPLPEDGPTASRIIPCFEKGLSEGIRNPDWSDLTFAHELLTGSHRSVQKKRTIEVHHDTTSERSQFKTQMTAAGCMLLLVTLGLMVGLMILGNILDPRETIEIKAEATDSIITQDQFVTGKAELSEAGKIRLAEIASRFEGSPMTVLVEQGGEDVPSELDLEREKTVINGMKELEVSNPEDQVTVTQIKGKSFTFLMRIGRVLVFLPLFVFLCFQFLIGLSRPSSR